LSEQLTKATQENILVLLTYSDNHCKFLRNAIDITYYESLYRDIAKKCYSFIDLYGEPPKDHIFDEFEEELTQDSKKAEVLKDTLIFIHDSQDDINVQYVLNSVRDFVRKQQLKSTVLKAAETIQREDESSIEETENILYSGIKNRNELFDPGTILTDFDKSLSFLDEDDSDVFPTGIKEFDYRGLGPVRGGLHLFIGAKKAGKSMWLLSLAKHAMLQGKSVLYVSLEMSEKLVSKRAFQTMFGVTKRKSAIESPYFITDSLGRFTDINFKQINPKLSLDDPDVYSELRKKVEIFGARSKNLIIKRFPTGSLTVNGLKSFLLSLENTNKFLPDLVLLDYPDLMNYDARNKRNSLGKIYEDLRGMAIEHNFALATVTQSNRTGQHEKIITDEHVSEDHSKIATADAVLTRSATDEEHALGLARMYVSQARDDESKITALIAQNYAMATFCTGSVMMNDSYWDIFKE